MWQHISGVSTSLSNEPKRRIRPSNCNKNLQLQLMWVKVSQDPPQLWSICVSQTHTDVTTACNDPHSGSEAPGARKSCATEDKCIPVWKCVWEHLRGAHSPSRNYPLPSPGGLCGGISQKLPGLVSKWFQHEERQNKCVQQLNRLFPDFHFSL